MRILFLAEAVSPHIARWESEFVKLGWEARVASCDYDDEFRGIRLNAKAASGPWRYLSIVDQVKQQIAEFQPHIINAHFLPTYGLTAAMANIHPLVLTLWGSDILLTGSKGVLRRLRSRFVLKRADLVVADAQCLIDATENIVKIERHLVVSFGVKRTWYESGESRELRDTEAVKLLSCRKFEDLYDVETLIRAARILADQKFSFRLTLVGTGKLESHLKLLIKELQLDSLVTMVGYLNDEQLFQAYRSHDVYVSTATSDSTSVSLLEAMSQKLYPVVTDIPGNREWLAGEDHFFKCGDASQLANKLRLGAARQAHEQAYANYQPLLLKKGIREEQMRIASLTFEKLIDEYSRR